MVGGVAAVGVAAEEGEPGITRPVDVDPPLGEGVRRGSKHIRVRESSCVFRVASEAV